MQQGLQLMMCPLTPAGGQWHHQGIPDSYLVIYYRKGTIVFLCYSKKDWMHACFFEEGVEILFHAPPSYTVHVCQRLQQWRCAVFDLTRSAAQTRIIGDRRRIFIHRRHKWGKLIASLATFFQIKRARPSVITCSPAEVVPAHLCEDWIRLAGIFFFSDLWIHLL